MTHTSALVETERINRALARATFRRLAAVAILCLGLASCSKKEAGELTPTVGVQVAGAVIQSIERKVVADATLYPLDQAAIVPKITSPVKKFYVDRGSRVQAGQLLAELENQDLVGAVAENQGTYQQAEVAYQTELQKAQQTLQLSKQTLDTQQKYYDGRQTLFKEGAASAKEVDDAMVALTQARNEYELAQKQHDLKAAEGGLSAAKGRNTTAEAQLGYSKITSPISGVVTDRPIYPGEIAPSGTAILTVMNLSQVVARAHIAQQEAAQLKMGDAATISGPDLGTGVRGKVTLVSPALDANSTTVEVWVQAPNADGRLKPGSSVRVTIAAETVPHAVVVPVAAVLTSDAGVTSVIVLDTDNAPHKKIVKVGIRDGANVQIVDGLKGGERVVTVGAFELAAEDEDVLPKTKIQVQAPKAADEVLEDDDEQ